jgi:hypothetical protein
MYIIYIFMVYTLPFGIYLHLFYQKIEVRRLYLSDRKLLPPIVLYNHPKYNNLIINLFLKFSHYNIYLYMVI